MGGDEVRPLSKTRYLSGLQCAKKLWVEVRDPGRLPEIGAATQFRFDQGHQVGRLAMRLYPGGIEIDSRTRQWSAVVSATERALGQRRTLFEAGFRSGGAACRVDILVPADAGRWDLLEVKSSTGIKDVHLQDVALQAHVVEGAGLSIRDFFLLYLNSDYVRRGPLVPEELFCKSKITEPVRARQVEVASSLAKMREIQAAESCPEVKIGPHCDAPYACPLKGECWSFLPPTSVFTLHAGRQLGFRLLEQGCVELAEIPDEVELTARQRIQLAVTRGGEPHIDRPALRQFLSGLEYPLYFFDLETFSSALPLLEGTRPYQQVPFLFSVHRLERPDVTARHFSYLFPGKGDPRPDVLRAVRSALESSGSIVAYNAPFERRVLAESSEVLPELRPWSEKLDKRFVDLLSPFRTFAFHHPDQQGSASLKSVLPALTGLGYGGLAITDGETASREYLRVTHGEVEPLERLRVQRELESYCGLDTQGMVEILRRLQSLSDQ